MVTSRPFSHALMYLTSPPCTCGGTSAHFPEPDGRQSIAAPQLSPWLLGCCIAHIPDAQAEASAALSRPVDEQLARLSGGKCIRIIAPGVLEPKQVVGRRQQPSWIVPDSLCSRHADGSCIFCHLQASRCLLKQLQNCLCNALW